MKRSRQAPSAKRALVGPHIVRAWFDTVVNPMLAALDNEHRLLVEKNWTWRFKPPALEAIRPLREYADDDAGPNFDQFNRLYSTVRTARRRHDLTVDALTKKCQRLHQALVESEEFRRLFRTVTSPPALRVLGKSRSDLFGAYPESEHAELVAQYVVNNAAEQPHYYTTAPLWSRTRADFLVLLERPRLPECWKATTATGRELDKTSQRLALWLERTRMTLSLEHDVPPAGRTGQSPG